MDDPKDPIIPARIEWTGDSRDVLRSFPKPSQFELGGEIWKLQIGQRPTNIRPMKSIGKGVFELRARDDAGWYRVIYLSKVDEVIYMLQMTTDRLTKYLGRLEGSPPAELTV